MLIHFNDHTGMYLGQRKVRNGPVCVNPFHYTPNGDMFELMRPLIATLDILGYSSDTYITQVCTQLHWDPTKQQFGSRNHTIARKAFDMIVSRVRQMQDESMFSETRIPFI